MENMVSAGSNAKFELSVPFSLHNKVCVLENNGKNVKFGLVDEENQNLKNQLKKNVRRFYHLDEDEILTFCKFEKISGDKLKKVVSFSYGESEGEEKRKKTKNSKNQSSENAAALLLDSLIEQACAAGATDIHLEENLVRFRMNGVLEKICALSVEKGRELVRRVKVLAKLDLMETRRGQDGQFVFHKAENQKKSGNVFVRVSCVPSVSRFYLDEKNVGNGNDSSESVVLRLLDVERQPLSVEKLGFSQKQIKVLRRLESEKNGLILICGATGSGKSTTAASLISEIAAESSGTKKIISVEDPPEYALENVTQIKADEKLGMSFSDSLRFVFRQDPDVIFIGEIRDEISAKTVVQASLTGHLVFATVHAGGISEAVLRLKELGAKEDELKSILLAVVFQELFFTQKKTEFFAEVFDFSHGGGFFRNGNSGNFENANSLSNHFENFDNFDFEDDFGDDDSDDFDSYGEFYGLPF